MIKYEKRILESIEENILGISVMLITIAAIAIRILTRDYASQDATYALLPWYDEIKAGGGIKSLSGQVGNYNILYQFLIAVMTYIPIKALWAYKILSCIFDFALGAVVAYLVYDVTENNRKWKAFFGYTLVICSPIVFLNSGMWAQCDSIYAFFILVAIVYMFQEKYAKSFLLLGISFAFKLQAVFILPFFLFVYFVKKKFSILNFLMIPVVMFLSGLPAVFMGRGIMEPFKIYLEQSDTYKSMFLKYPSFWAVFCPENNSYQYESLKGAAMLFTVVVLAVLMLLWIVKKVQINKKNLLYIAFLLTYTCVLFLPAMHERYGYVFEILAVIILFINRKTILPAVSLWMVTLTSYACFLLNNPNINMQILAVINLIIYAAYLLILSKEILKKSDEMELKVERGENSGEEKS